MSTMHVANNTMAFWKSIFDLFGNQGAITVPSNFHEQVKEIKYELMSDSSGIVNTLLDYYISCAMVNFEIECSNSSLKDELNDWLKNINVSLRGKKVEVGIKGLARQYFRERWKGSSLMLARSTWAEGDLSLPDKIWFVDGGSLKVTSDKVNAIIGNEVYSLMTKTNDNKNEIKLPKVEGEEIFIQSPYASTGVDYPYPFLVQRGLLHNMKFMRTTSGQIEKIIAKAMPYMLLMKKGSEALALANKASYTGEDLKQLQMNFSDFKNKADSGSDTLFTNFDTQMEHFFPDYSKILQGEVFAPIERKLLEGLGMIEIVEGVGTTRKEAVFNPKPMLREVKQGVNDFCSFLNDVIAVIMEKNTKKNLAEIKIKASPIEDSISANLRDHFRRLYERGVLSKQTYGELCGNGYVDYDLERERRMTELKRGDEILMFPQQIQNTEQNVAPEEVTRNENQPGKKPKEEVVDDKKQNKQDYVASMEDIAKELEISVEELGKVYESAPYKSVDDLDPKIKKVLEPKLQKTFINVFNTAFEKYKNEKTAFKVAWSVINRIAKKDKDGIWRRKKVNGSYEQALIQEILDGGTNG